MEEADKLTGLDPVMILLVFGILNKISRICGWVTKTVFNTKTTHSEVMSNPCVLKSNLIKQEISSWKKKLNHASVERLALPIRSCSCSSEINWEEKKKNGEKKFQTFDADVLVVSVA